MVEHRLVQRLADANLSQRRVVEGVRREARALRVAHGNSHYDRLARAHDELLTHRRAAGVFDVHRHVVGCCVHHGFAEVAGVGVFTLGAGHESQAVNQLAAGGPLVASAQAVDDFLRLQLTERLVLLLALRRVDHHEIALVFARVEVLRRTTVIRAEAAAVVPVGAGEEPEAAAFTEQSVPHAAHLRAIDAGAAPSGAADAVVLLAAEAVAVLIVLAAVFRGAVARLRFEAEGNVGAGIV